MTFDDRDDSYMEHLSPQTIGRRRNSNRRFIRQILSGYYQIINNPLCI